jgi:hypothetical protein
MAPKKQVDQPPKPARNIGKRIARAMEDSPVNGMSASIARLMSKS